MGLAILVNGLLVYFNLTVKNSYHKARVIAGGAPGEPSRFSPTTAAPLDKITS